MQRKKRIALVPPPNEVELPLELRDKFPQTQYDIMVKFGWLSIIIGVGLAVLSMYGRIKNQEHNGLAFFVVPFVAPCIAALGTVLVPYNPYKSPLFAGKFVGLDSRDQDAKRLVALFKSSAANQFIMRETFKLAIILFSIMVLIALFVHSQFQWSIAVNDLFISVVGAVVGSFVVLSSRQVRWGLNAWKKQYLQQHNDK